MSWGLTGLIVAAAVTRLLSVGLFEVCMKIADMPTNVRPSTQVATSPDATLCKPGSGDDAEDGVTGASARR